MLKYLYTRNLPTNITCIDMIEELLDLCERYQLSFNLKLHCEKQMFYMLDIDKSRSCYI